MENLVKSPDLFVVQVEMDIYTMLKKVSKWKNLDSSLSIADDRISKLTARNQR